MTSETTPVLTLVRVFDAEPRDVFDAWLDEAQFKSWIGPVGVPCDVTLFEPRVGGRYRLTMRPPGAAAIPVAGEFRAIDAPRSFTMTWGAEGDPTRQATLVVTLKDLGGRTEMTLREEGLPVRDHDGNRRGWGSAFDKLAAYLRNR